MRLVDADALIKDINARISVYDRNFEYGAVSGLVDALECVKEAQTVDATEVIRCEYCDHRKQYRFPPKYEVRDYCEVHEKVTTLTNFCSWAERKQDG